MADFRFYCQTCPYIYLVKQTLSKQVTLERKKVDDVLGGAEAWENADKTEVGCPRCSHTEAYFKQIQIRSADEPSTLFYRCANHSCAHQWNEN